MQRYKTDKALLKVNQAEMEYQNQEKRFKLKELKEKLNLIIMKRNESENAIII